MSSIETVADATHVHAPTPTGAPPSTFKVDMFVSRPFTEKRGEDGLSSVFSHTMTHLGFAEAVGADDFEIDQIFKMKQLSMHQGVHLYQHFQGWGTFNRGVFDESAERAKQSINQGDQFDAQFYIKITRVQTNDVVCVQSHIRAMQLRPNNFEFSPGWYFFN